jgi:hypothetical protein
LKTSSRRRKPNCREEDEEEEEEGEEEGRRHKAASCCYSRFTSNGKTFSLSRFRGFSKLLVSASSLSLSLSLSFWKQHFVELGGIHKTPSDNRQKRRIQNPPFLVGWMNCCQLLLEFSKQLLQKMFCSQAEGKAVAPVCSSLPC